ncbi:hypothetical protein, partial [Hyphomicrobium sp.]|uniref:hypothetical protein n=1 Tax=Hyphomicrobium sp. TaxID=82 RepID=UPI002BDB85AB
MSQSITEQTLIQAAAGMSKERGALRGKLCAPYVKSSIVSAVLENMRGCDHGGQAVGRGIGALTPT